MSIAPGSITSLVNGLRNGTSPDDGSAFLVVYEELTALAQARVRATRGSVNLFTADLVNEAYLKLFARPGAKPWESRRHFYGSAIRAMHQIVTDLARSAQSARKHAPNVARPSVTLPAPFNGGSPIRLLDLLEELGRIDPVASQIVSMRFFFGMQMQEVAEILEVSPRSADRKWSLARAWLLGRMTSGADGEAEVPWSD